MITGREWACIRLAREYLRDYDLDTDTRADEAQRLAETFMQVARDYCENLPRKAATRS